MPAAHLHPLPGSPKAPSQTPVVLKNITGPCITQLETETHVSDCTSSAILLGGKPLSLVSEFHSQPLMTGPAKLLCMSPPAVGGGFRAPARVGFRPSGLPYF